MDLVEGSIGQSEGLIAGRRYGLCRLTVSRTLTACSSAKTCRIYIRNLASEVGPSGVRVLGMWVAGIPETLTKERIASVNSAMQLDDAALQGILSHLDGLRMMKRSPSLAEVAEVAVFLASDRSAGMTGTFTNVTQMFPS